MMFRKVAKCLMISALAVFLTVGCSQPSSSDSGTGNNTENTGGTGNAGNTDNTGDTGNTGNSGDTEKPVADPSVVNFKDYHIKVSKLPYDSTGLTVLALAESEKYKDVKKELGKVISTEKDAVVEKTVSLPDEYDKLYIVFVTDSDELKYFCNIIPQNYNKTEALWDVDGFYYYRPKTAADKSTPYAATDESKIEELELDKQYDFDAAKLPYLIFHADNVIDKVLKLSVTGSSKVDFYISSNKAKIMTYQADKLSGDFYKCETQNIYIMLRPKEYDFSEGVTQPKCSFTFTDFTPELEKCLRIDKSVLASNGKIYASGTTGDSETKEILYCLDPKNNLSRTRVKNFNKTITSICELEEGILYVAYDYSISKVDISTGTVSTFVTDLPASPREMAMYKNGKILIAGIEKDRYSIDYLLLLDKETGTYSEVKEQNGSWGILDVKDLQYYQNGDIFFYSFSGSPRDICYIKLDMTNPAMPEYVSIDSKYHGAYKMDYPVMIYKTNPLQILTGAGEIFDIDLSVIETADTTLAPAYYKKQVEDWCLYNDTSFRAYNDCYIMGEYIYYMNYDLINDTCSVEKCALTEPKTVLKQEIYENEVPVKLYKADNKLYLLTNSYDCIYPGQGDYYKVYLHEIDF